MKRLIAAALAVTAIAGSANAAITAHTGAFLTTVTNTNGFEGMPFTDAWNGPYTEDGITAEYIGGICSSFPVNLETAFWRVSPSINVWGCSWRT